MLSFIFYKTTSLPQSTNLSVTDTGTLQVQAFQTWSQKHLRWTVRDFNHRADLTNQPSNKNSGSYPKSFIYERHYVKWCLQ